MTWLENLSLSDTSHIILLVFCAGLISYAVDYRWVKDKSDMGRETNFAKAASYFYVFGSIVSYIAFVVLQSAA